MTEFAVLRKSDGERVAVFSVDGETPVELNEYPFATHDYEPIPQINDDGSIEGALVTRYNGRRILTKLEFRSLFSDATIKWIDRFEAQFEGYAYLTDDQKDNIRTAFANYHEATEIDLDDPRWPPGLGLYVALGGMDADEVTEVLRG